MQESVPLEGAEVERSQYLAQQRMPYSRPRS